MRGGSPLSPPRRIAALLALLGVTVCLGWADVVTGPELAFSLFYLVPIFVSAWWLGWLSTAIIAFTSGVAWLEAEVILRPEQAGGVLAWNGLTRGVIFFVVGMLVCRMRAQGARLSSLNQALAESLRREEGLARTDPLTGLPNRRAFREELSGLLSRSRRSGQPMAVLWLDLDNFKQLNDRYGHEAGDQALRAVAELLHRALRLEDAVARLGGDEFAAVLLGLSPADAEAAGLRLRDGVAALGLAWPEARLGASVGVAWIARPPEDAVSLLREADAAMYQGKALGKGQVVLLQLSEAPRTGPAAPEASLGGRVDQASGISSPSSMPSSIEET